MIYIFSWLETIYFAQINSLYIFSSFLLRNVLYIYIYIYNLNHFCVLLPPGIFLRSLYQFYPPNTLQIFCINFVSCWFSPVFVNLGLFHGVVSIVHICKLWSSWSTFLGEMSRNVHWTYFYSMRKIKLKRRDWKGLWMICK